MGEEMLKLWSDREWRREVVREVIEAAEMTSETLDAVASRHLHDWVITPEDACELGLAGSRLRQALAALRGSDG